MREKILNDLKEAMKNQDKETLSVIRMVKGAMQMQELDKKANLTDDEVIGVIAKEIKTRKESIVEFEKGGRSDLIEKTNKEIEILNKYMPEQLSEEEVNKIIDEEFNEPFYDAASFERLKEILNDPVFRERLGHFLFLISSDLMDNYSAPDGENWDFYFSDGAGPVDLTPADCYHSRENDYMVANLGEDNPIADLMNLVPRAGHSYQQ